MSEIPRRAASRTFVIGDIHGCGIEFCELLERMGLQPSDTVISVGDAFDRGPDPLTVLEIFLGSPRMEMVLGNHEIKLLRHLRYEAGETVERPHISRTQQDSMAKLGPKREELKTFLEMCDFKRPGPDRAWFVVHAGVHPGKGIDGSNPDELTTIRRVAELPGNPLWYDAYAEGPLILFGHMHADEPVERRDALGRRLALGLDTGCVYGGRLTAYCIEEDRFHTVKTRQTYYRERP